MNFGIIAAGDGSRLVAEGVSTPKPLLNLCGKPMLGRLLDIMQSHNPGRIVICVNEYMTEVQEWIKRNVTGDNVFLKVKTTPSSMHTFAEVASGLRGRGRFVVTTVDTIFCPDAFDAYVRTWRDAPASQDALMGVTDFIDDEKPLYVSVDNNYRITAFTDTLPQSADTGHRHDMQPDTPCYVSAGIYGLDDSAVDLLDDCLLSGVSRMRNFQRALVAADLDLRAFPMGKVMDIDHADDIIKARDFLNSNL